MCGLALQLCVRDGMCCASVVIMTKLLVFVCVPCNCVNDFGCAWGLCVRVSTGVLYV